MRILVVTALLTAPAAAQDLARVQNPDARQGLSGLPTPRFVSLNTGLARMRTGPGDQYPIKWIYRREGLPLEVVREWGIWRQVRDPDGETGWMNKALLAGDRTVVVTRTERPLYARADTAARVVWRAEPGVVARVTMCARDWCRVSVDGRSGYLLRAHAWGTYRGETVE